MKMNLKQGDLENIILNALWDLEQEGRSRIYVGDVQDAIRSSRPNAKEWAYTTVKTVMDRLVDKEMAQREKDGKKYFYRSVLKRDEAGEVALVKLLRQYFQNDIESLESCLAQVRDRLPEAGGKPFATRPTSLKKDAATAATQARELAVTG